MKFHAYIICILALCSATFAEAQNDGGRLSGSLETNANFFIRDSLIGAANTPQYDRQKFGGEGWLNLNYNNWGFDFGLRYDFFNNSNLLNPTGSYTDQGIGMCTCVKELTDWALRPVISTTKSGVVSSSGPLNNAPC